MGLLSFREIRIFVVRRRTILLLLAVFLIVVLLVRDHDSPTSHRRRFFSKSHNEPITQYNLLEETEHQPRHVKDCTLEYANSHRLQQDHPCVLELIRRQYLNKPPPSEVPLELHQPEKADPSAGQAKAIMRILRNQTGGFFVECGAADGEFLSTTLFIERFMNWTGLLIEPEPGTYTSLLTRKRKSWTVPGCLSLKTYPTQVSFKKVFGTGSIQEDSSWLGNNEVVTAQCFPFYSILLAFGRVDVDFFSLDVEGHELRVLKTVPWHKVDVKTIAVEWEHIPDGPEALVSFMKSNGFVNFGRIATKYARDMVFVKDHLRDLRYDYDD